ncbi:MAG: AGE family epimerase/isomerase [Acidobacteria bacterium]|nr:AGE family epimerase/isomerase [Acidobacteriota bacterium]MBV9481978.1 AGE family epimerase/isomerase [Acidobacteriota bacterium]
MHLKMGKIIPCAALLFLCSTHQHVFAQMNGEATRDWPVVIRDTLQHTVLQFWIDHALDKEYGGIYGRLDRQGRPTDYTNKSVVLISRTLWSFSEAYRRYPDPAYQKMAAECLRFLRETMWDKQHGGYYFMVSREGRIVNSNKELNPMSYTIEGLAEYALAFHDDKVAQEALDLFRVIDQRAHDHEHGGYRIAFTADWQFIKDYKEGPNAAGSFGRKSYDWHLGLVEALATLYGVTGDQQVKARLNELLDIFVNKIIDLNVGYGRYYFNDDWSVADRDGDSRQCEYGLDLEASWLMTEAAQRVGRQNDPKIRHASLALVDHALRYGFDKEHGGVYRTGPAAGPATNRDMEWWQQCEAMVAFLNSYQFTGEANYWQAFDREGRFFIDRWVDHYYGEVYTALYHDGTVDDTKVDPWKAPYHVTRACLEIISRLGGTL